MTTRRHWWPAAVIGLVVAGSLAAQEPAIDLPPGLPPQEEVMRALRESPRLQAAAELITRGEARRRRLLAGPHEWEIDTLLQQRKDMAGVLHEEQEYGLQTGMRWPWKASLDRQMGSLAKDIGELAYVDAWHEAARELLDNWFTWVRSERLLALLEQQSMLVQSQQETVTRRVAAGDAPSLELQLAQAEIQRLRASRSAALRDAQRARESVASEFPLLTLKLPPLGRVPTELTGDDPTWIQLIVDHNHEIELAGKQRDEASVAAERAGRDRFADPTVGLRYTDNLGGERRVVGVTFRLPLGGAGRAADAALARSGARVADSEARRTSDRVNAMARVVVADARQSYLGWQDQQAGLLVQKAAADAVAKGYALGEFDISVLLAARRSALEAEQATLDALVSAHRSYARALLDGHRLWAAPDHDHDHDHGEAVRP